MINCLQNVPGGITDTAIFSMQELKAWYSLIDLECTHVSTSSIIAIILSLHPGFLLKAFVDLKRDKIARTRLQKSKYALCHEKKP